MMMRHRPPASCALALLATLAALVTFLPRATAAGEAVPQALTILWTGETHAMLGPCICPYRPEGGLARRAAAVAAERERGPVVLVDSGGWAAGGIYDEYTEGPEVDGIRTRATLRAMVAMGYDAIAVSDEELAGGGEFIGSGDAKGAPLVSANLRAKEGGAAAARPWVLIERAGRRVGVVGLTTMDLGLLAPKAVGRFETTDPVAAARRAVRDVRAAGAEIVIVLSPLGEELSERVAREVEGVDLVLNAHRRSTASAYFRAGGATVAQFDFQGRLLLRARVSFEGGTPLVEMLEPVKLGKAVPDDPTAAKIVAEAELEIAADASRRVLTVKLFKMALCPYAPKVEGTLAELGRALPRRVALRVTHVVRVDPRGRLTSMHGEPEVEEARRQAAIFEFYPRRYWDYAAWRAKDPAGEGWERECRRLGMSVARLRGCVASGEADAILRRHADRSERLRVSGSPTLYLGGKRYEGPVSREGVLRVVCSELPGGAEGIAACKGLPKCFSDADCRKPGFVGECAKPGTPAAECRHHPAVRVPLTIVADGRAAWSPVARIVESLQVFFPGLDERKVDSRSDEGRSLLKRYKLDRLPAYILGKQALEERNIETVRPALTPVADALVLSPGLAGSHQDITRDRRPGRVDLFLAPHSKAAADALAEALDLMERGEAPWLRLRAAVYRDREWRLAAPGGLAELEEMLRQIAVAETQPRLLAPYLRARLKHVGSSYWEDPLREAGLDPAVVRNAADSGLAAALLDADAQALAEIGGSGPVVLLVANQELVPVGSRAELRHAVAAAREEALRLADGPPRTASRVGNSQDVRRSEALKLLRRALENAPASARDRLARGIEALGSQPLER
ncbi:MAG: hypothetical protein ACYTKD_06900 [Planctomycetota bacterium]